MNIVSLKEKCNQLRVDTLNEIYEAGSGHPGGSLSMVEIMVSLYYYKMNINPGNPKDPFRDRFVLSKGHAAPILYAVLADKGYFDKKMLKTLRKLHSPLQGHPDKKKLSGVDASTGSLGQGVSVATGMALGAKTLNNGVHVYAVLGDGELQEGIVWEAAMAASHYKLDNLTVIVDNNGLQIDGSCEQVMGVDDIGRKYESFGFTVYDVADGNDLEQIIKALDAPFHGKPKCIVAHTIKGKGVSFMENVVGWHGKSLNDEELEKALTELGGAKAPESRLKCQI
ncbi:MAG: transketolase [Anaerocolumna aminovalerica]|uniref:transketolase n=1 Tax=Anaerocolumna aminovalerica TaxID=1527 RepID=UPI001C0F2C43|nr:transketolase [Anaerocolumna aminovalerica]MBU5331196.1 transketolase [Anaerocolumna aminovalerica]MDU6263232.1 transketolase [Anaerocolumna aminovalerica]